MDDPVLNCLLAVCCPPEAQRALLAKELVKAGACNREYAPTVAAWVLEHFDLAPAGSLTQFKATIARLARGADHGATE